MIRQTINRVLRKLASDDTSSYWTIKIPKPGPDSKFTKAIVDGWSDEGLIAPDYSEIREPASSKANRALQDIVYNREARKRGMPQRFSKTPGGARAYLQDINNRPYAYLGALRARLEAKGAPEAKAVPKAEDPIQRPVLRGYSNARLAGARRHLQYHNTQLNKFMPWRSSTPNYNNTTY